MAGQERTAVRTTGSRGQVTSDMVRLYNTSYRKSYARGGGDFYPVINDIKSISRSSSNFPHTDQGSDSDGLYDCFRTRYWENLIWLQASLWDWLHSKPETSYLSQAQYGPHCQPTVWVRTWYKYGWHESEAKECPLVINQCRSESDSVNFW